MFALVAIGTSVPPAHARAEAALEALRKHTAWQVRAQSDIVETPAWGGATAQRFCNAAVVLETGLSAPAILRALWALELRAGRVRTLKNGPRTLDLDLLATEGCEVEAPGLALPHPGLMTRDFAREPAAEALRRGWADGRVPRAFGAAVVSGCTRFVTA